MMQAVNIAELKNNLIAYLEQVKNGADPFADGKGHQSRHGTIAILNDQISFHSRM